MRIIAGPFKYEKVLFTFLVSLYSPSDYLSKLFAM